LETDALPIELLAYSVDELRINNLHFPRDCIAFTHRKY
jgi:hypothetical protein